MNQQQQDRFYKLLGENIKDSRKQRGLTQEQLAINIELTRTSIVNIEKGRQRPPLHQIFDIAQKLQIDVKTLIPLESAFMNGTMFDGSNLDAVSEKDISKITSFVSDFVNTQRHEQEEAKTD